MEESRVVIETSKYQREALEHVLKERGMTLTEWFNEKVVEASHQMPLFLENLKEIKSLRALQNNDAVLISIQNVNWAFTEANTTYLSHNIHPYPAKFIPQIPKYLISLLSVKGEKIWDPFGGSGTTAVEALLLDRQAISSDINPVASLVGKAKTLTLSKEDDDIISDFLERLRILSENDSRIMNTIGKCETDLSKYIPEIPNIEKWFHPNAIQELALIRYLIEKIESEKAKVLLKAAFSKIIVKASFQDGETRYSSKFREINHSEILRMFVSELSSSLNKVRKISPLMRFKEAEFVNADLRKQPVVEPNSIDLIITSPPYANATDYFLYHRFRLFWLGYDPREYANSEIGSHLRHQKEHTGMKEYTDEMIQCLCNMYKGLRNGRFAVIVLGDAVFDNEKFNTAEILSYAAKEIGFECVGIVKRKVHLTKRSFISAARRLEEESILVLRKPTAKLSITLFPPNYKLWEYEEEIRKKEIENLFNQIPTVKESSKLVIDIDSLQVDTLRRLTFSHSFESETYHKNPTWQSLLENGDSNLQGNRKDPKYVTHGLHPYKGKFYPQLAKSLINIAHLEPGQSILDPFCGSGTVLLEGCLNGLMVKGFDINPLALKIARAKTEIIKVDPYLTDRLLKYVIDKLNNMQPINDYCLQFNQEIIPELESWFPYKVLNKIGAIFKLIEDIPEPSVKEFVEICLSSIIRDISQQEPLDLRIRRRKIPLEDAPVLELLQKRIIDQRNRLIKFARISNKAPFILGQTQVIFGDSRCQTAFRDASIESNSIDAVITSPPYATALPYIDTDRLSILLLFNMLSKTRNQIEMNLIGSREITKKEKYCLEEKIDTIAFKEILSTTAKDIIQEIFTLNNENEVGFRKENMASLIFRYYRDMSIVFKNLNNVVTQNGSIFMVIGDNVTEAGNKKVPISSSKVLQEIGTSIGWELMEIIPITVTQENRLHNKNGITRNDIIWFKKNN